MLVQAAQEWARGPHPLTYCTGEGEHAHTKMASTVWAVCLQKSMCSVPQKWLHAPVLVGAASSCVKASVSRIVHRNRSAMSPVRSAEGGAADGMVGPRYGGMVGVPCLKGRPAQLSLAYPGALSSARHHASSLLRQRECWGTSQKDWLVTAQDACEGVKAGWCVWVGWGWGHNGGASDSGGGGCRILGDIGMLSHCHSSHSAGRCDSVTPKLGGGSLMWELQRQVGWGRGIS